MLNASVFKALQTYLIIDWVQLGLLNRAIEMMLMSLYCIGRANSDCMFHRAQSAIEY